LTFEETRRMEMFRKWIVPSITLMILAFLTVAAVRAGPTAPGADLGTAFTYQGQLNLDGQPVDNTCNFQFSLYDDELGNVQIGATQTITGVGVSTGLFTVQLDFGASTFQGNARWLGVQVQCQGDAAYADLGLQALTAAPYALHALSTPWDGISDMPAGFADGVDDVGTGDYWSLTGNAGTDPASHFLGTSDGVSLTLAVSGTPALRLEPTGGTPNLIGGSEYNTMTLGVVGSTIGGGGSSTHPNRVMDSGATVGGGEGNTASGHEAIVGGGGSNTASGSVATVGGGHGNAASDLAAVVGGGGYNTASGEYATVGGGGENVASDSAATVSGGQSNTANGLLAIIGGGYGNIASGIGAFIGGGGYDGITSDGNEALGDASTIGGGLGNVVTATATYATIGGGEDNLVTPTYGTIAGGYQNAVTDNGTRATVGGGCYNTASGFAATIGGGMDNTASDSGATVGGGDGNTASWNHATVGGGWNNTASAFHTTVGGGWENIASGFAAAVGGGAHNTASGIGAFVGGGGQDGSIADGNEALGDASTIGGGMGNIIATTGNYATIGGGWNNTVSGYYAVVGGGQGNIASDSSAAVGGGYYNTASGSAAAVGGGYDNAASGNFATVPGGLYNTASGDYSFAAGRRAQANHDGTIILADSNDFDFASLSPNTFKVRATGGIRFVLGIDGSGDPTWSCLVQDGNSWSCSSDRNLKENLDLVEGDDVLQRLAEVPIYTWNGKGQDPALRHMGPMAQDFYAAFNLGGDDTHIATIDLDGVALAAIQGLYAQNQVLETENANLHQRVDDLEARLSALEAQVSGDPAASPVQVSLLPGAGLFLVGGVGLWLVHSRQHSEFIKGEDER
jgi:hypothetical protein